jgi:hypothetical protein
VPPARLNPKPCHALINIVRFKDRAREVLPPSHPLRRVLDRTADALTPEEISAKLDDWLVLIEE